MNKVSGFFQGQSCAADVEKDRVRWRGLYSLCGRSGGDRGRPRHKTWRKISRDYGFRMISSYWRDQDIFIDYDHRCGQGITSLSPIQQALVQISVGSVSWLRFLPRFSFNCKTNVRTQFPRTSFGHHNHPNHFSSVALALGP